MSETIVDVLQANAEEELFKKRLKDIVDLAESQGIRLNNTSLTKSIKELEELENFVKAVKQVAEDPNAFTNPLQALGSARKSLDFKDMAGLAVTSIDTVNLFDEYLVNMARKSYDNLMKIKANPESTNFDFFKGCVQCCVDIFFGIQAFRKKAQEKHPGLIAVEVLFAAQLAPVYAVASVFSAVLNLCGYKDSTAELIKGGKELKSQAIEAKKLLDSIEQEQGIKVNDFSRACETLNEAGVFGSILAVAYKVNTLDVVAKELVGMSNDSKVKTTTFIRNMSEIVAKLPNSKEDVSKFLNHMAPNNLPHLDDGQRQVIDTLRDNLMKIKYDSPKTERVASSIMALQKFTNDFKKVKGRVSDPLTNLTNQIISICNPLIQMDQGDMGVVTKELGCGKAFVHAVTELAKAFKPNQASVIAR